MYYLAADIRADDWKWVTSIDEFPGRRRDTLMEFLYLPILAPITSSPPHYGDGVSHHTGEGLTSFRPQKSHPLIGFVSSLEQKPLTLKRAQ